MLIFVERREVVKPDVEEHEVADEVPEAHFLLQHDLLEAQVACSLALGQTF